MFQFMRGITLGAGMFVDCGATFAEDIESANYVMRGCRSFVAAIVTAQPPRNSVDAFLADRCLGIVDTISDIADVCGPADVTSGQVASVVVKYIDERPTRMHEKFIVLAREALQAAWPCRN